MNILALIVAGLLGLLFVFAGGSFLLGMIPDQPAPLPGSLTAQFMGAFVPSGYMHFVKILEVVGGILIMIPILRPLGLLVLGPIIVNILATSYFIMASPIYTEPVLIFMVVASAFLLFVERGPFLALILRRQ